jgi:hypothetical protein
MLRRRHPRVAFSLLAFAVVVRAQEPAEITSRYGDVVTRITAAALLQNRAYDLLTELCDGIGHRLSGSPQLERAVEWAAGAMKAAGFDEVRLQPCLVPHWVRGSAKLEMLSPRREAMPLLALGGSVPTPEGGLEAEVVAVRSFAELEKLGPEKVRGKIVVYDVPYEGYGATVQFRGSGASRAARLGAVAALNRSAGFGGNRTPHTGALSYAEDAPKIPAAAIAPEDSAMIGRLYRGGATVRLKLELGCRTLPDAISHNVIGRYLGSEKPEEFLVVGGHLDSWDVGQGAQDDGGGCVSVLESVALLKRLGLRPRRTIEVVLFTNEENGLRGARAYADEAAPRLARCIGAYENDGGTERPIGFGVTFPAAPGEPPKTRPRSSESRPASRPASRPETPAEARRFARFAAATSLLAGVGADQARLGGGGADVGPLLERGVPTLSITTVGARYFEWHHTEGDTLDKVASEDLTRHVAAQAALFYVVADLVEPL